VIDSGASSDEWKAFLVETQQEALRTYQHSIGLGKRGSAALRSVVALQNEWSTLRPSKSSVADFRDAIDRLRFLAKEFSDWIKEHPETDGDFLKNRLAKLRDSSRDEKIAFVKNFRDDRIFRFEHQLPELEGIVEKLEASTLRLSEIVLRANR